MRLNHRVSQNQITKDLVNVPKHLMDEVSIQIADLNSIPKIYLAYSDYHSSCYSNYIQKCKAETKISGDEDAASSNESFSKSKQDILKCHVEFIISLFQESRRLSFSDAVEMINNRNNINLRNSEIKYFLIKYFSFKKEKTPCIYLYFLQQSTCRMSSTLLAILILLELQEKRYEEPY